MFYQVFRLKIIDLFKQNKLKESIEKNVFYQNVASQFLYIYSGLITGCQFIS